MTEDTSPKDTESINPSSDPIEVAQRHAKMNTPADQPPTQIGPYKILGELGVGGMGVVFLAEQTKPIHRRVALKIIKLGMDTKQVVARFETEREALALMNHPNVAKVFDAGATEQGRPYFAMEYIAGIPITDYCDKHRLNTEERLRLFMEVCLAVQHAHQKGIIHRDIKPSNVLVAIQDGHPIPKVIDFGVAKATQHRLTERTLFTEQGQLIGTPGYMSPEQAEMTALDTDTRTDIYSLGVLLYELLVGALPFENKTLFAGGLAEIQRIIREVDPPKPSTRLSNLGDASTAIAYQRRTQVRTLARELRGDVDWIVMKCLEKDRTRRYDTATGLTLEIQRYLSNEPVLAGPPSSAYRLKKFVRRKKGLFIAMTAVFVVLVTGIIVSTSLFLRAREARMQAAIQAANAEFQARAARTEVARTVVELDRLMPQLRIAHDLSYFADESRLAEYPQATLDEPDSWLERLFIEWFPERAKEDGHEIDGGLIDDEMRSLLDSVPSSNYTDIRAPKNAPLFDWIRSNRKRLDLLISQSQQYQFDFSTRIKKPDDMAYSFMSPTLSTARFAGKLLFADTWVHVLDGEPDEAIESLKAARRIARYAGNSSQLIGSLVEYALMASAYDAMRQMLLDAVAGGRLPTTYVGFVHDDPPVPPIGVALLYEGRASRQLVSQLFAHKAADEAPQLDLGRLRALSELGFPTARTELPLAFREALEAVGYESTMETIDRAVDRLKVLQHGSFRELLQAEAHEAAIFEENPLLRPLFSSLVRCFYLRCRLMMDRDATIISLALCRYRVMHGSWPNSLGEAVAGSDLQPMRTQYFDAPFLYRIVDGQPLLYTVGDDFEDNEGRPKMHPIVSPDGSKKWDYVLLASPQQADSFEIEFQPYDVHGNGRANIVDKIAGVKRDAQRPDADPDTLKQAAWKLLTCRPSDLRDPAAALAFAKEAVARDPERDFDRLATLALAYRMTGDMKKAVELQSEALADAKKPINSWTSTITYETTLASFLKEVGDYAGADSVLRGVLDRARAKSNPKLENVMTLAVEVALSLLAQEEYEVHNLFCNEFDDILKSGVIPPKAPGVANTVVGLGVRFINEGDYLRAEGLLRNCLAIRQIASPQDYWRVPNTLSILGASLTGQGKFTDAEPVLLNGYNQLKNTQPVPPQALKEALERIIQLYEKWDASESGKGHAEKATEWRTRLGQVSDVRPLSAAP